MHIISDKDCVHADIRQEAQLPVLYCLKKKVNVQVTKGNIISLVQPSNLNFEATSKPDKIYNKGNNTDLMQLNTIFVL